MKVHLSKYYIGGEKQKRPNKGPFFVTHGIERVKRGGGKGHIYTFVVVVHQFYVHTTTYYPQKVLLTFPS